MSLKINNLATDKQKEMLLNLGYVGTGNYTIDKLDKQEASELISELLEEERLSKHYLGWDIDASDSDTY